MKHHSRLCQFEVKLLAIPAAGWRGANKRVVQLAHGAKILVDRINRHNKIIRL